jgi:hypothetical protein
VALLLARAELLERLGERVLLGLYEALEIERIAHERTMKAR